MKKTVTPKRPKKLHLSLETINVTELSRVSGGVSRGYYVAKTGAAGGGDDPVEVC